VHEKQQTICIILAVSCGLLLLPKLWNLTEAVESTLEIRNAAIQEALSQTIILLTLELTGLGALFWGLFVLVLAIDFYRFGAPETKEDRQKSKRQREYEKRLAEATRQAQQQN